MQMYWFQYHIKNVIEQVLRYRYKHSDLFAHISVSFHKRKHDFGVRRWPKRYYMHQKCIARYFVHYDLPPYIFTFRIKLYYISPINYSLAYVEVHYTGFKMAYFSLS